MPKDIHAHPFSQNTKDKLWLYGEYIKEALPVFLTLPNIDTIHIYDFFAGPGENEFGEAGSPLVACDAVKYVVSGVPPLGKRLHLYFNEKEHDKYLQLQSHAENMRNLPFISDVTVENKSFANAFNDMLPELLTPRTAKIIFIDQYGLKEVTKSIFETLASLPYTDFMFFLSSSFASRFATDEKAIWRHLPPISDSVKENIEHKNIHRILASAYNQWIPSNATCYLGNFSFKKDANIYGLVFGSGNPLGLLKFLNKAWKLAEQYCGQADYDIDGDHPIKGQLFLIPELSKPKKLRHFKDDLLENILSHKLLTNKDIFLFSISYGVLPKHAHTALNELIHENKIPKQSLHVAYDAWKSDKIEQIQLK